MTRATATSTAKPFPPVLRPHPGWIAVGLIVLTLLAYWRAGEGGFVNLDDDAYVEFQPPVPVERLLEYLSAAAAPCALFAMGVTLALRPLKRVPRELLPIAVLKLILHPLVCWIMLSLIGDFSATWIFSAVLLAALPTATNVFVIAQQYGVWVERASASILLTTLMSVATVTALLYLITSGALPPDLFP